MFSDRDLTSHAKEVEADLQGADAVFCSLIFDYDQVMWLRERMQYIPIRLVFEPAPELMSLTRLGKFVMGDQPNSIPKPIKFILSKFSSGREEDKVVGYLSFLKTDPKLLKFVPIKKVQDLRHWLMIYGYWNAGGSDNVAALFWFLAETYLGLAVGDIPPPQETPNLGPLHPSYSGYFESPGSTSPGTVKPIRRPKTGPWWGCGGPCGRARLARQRLRNRPATGGPARHPLPLLGDNTARRFAVSGLGRGNHAEHSGV